MTLSNAEKVALFKLYENSLKNNQNLFDVILCENIESPEHQTQLLDQGYVVYPLTFDLIKAK